MEDKGTYTEYGYRGIEEIKRLQEENARLKKEIEELKDKQITLSNLYPDGFSVAWRDLNTPLTGEIKKEKKNDR